MEDPERNKALAMELIVLVAIALFLYFAVMAKGNSSHWFTQAGEYAGMGILVIVLIALALLAIAYLVDLIKFIRRIIRRIFGKS